MRIVDVLVLAASGAFTGLASVGAWRVLLDLVVLSCIVMGWQDLRWAARNAWSLAVFTLTSGSLGSLPNQQLTPARHDPLRMTS